MMGQMMTAPPHRSIKVSTNKAEREDANVDRSVSSLAATRHDEFYFTDDMTVFRVENRLFRVHRYFLIENSPIFSAMFSLPRGANSTEEGTSDANPIYLSGITELEFETLLRFFFNGLTLPQESWITLLSVAHRYDFLTVRERAISEIYGPFQDSARQKNLDILMANQAKGNEQQIQQELQQHNYWELISVAEKYDVPLCHIVPLLVPFVMRVQPLTVREVLRFSALTVTRLAHAREDFLRKKENGRIVTRYLDDANGIIDRVWQAVVEN